LINFAYSRREARFATKEGDDEPGKLRACRTAGIKQLVELEKDRKNAQAGGESTAGESVGAYP
jgi:hypothetical protein